LGATRLSLPSHSQLGVFKKKKTFPNSYVMVNY
jgi:hypothetical protein